jgi:hypothetical protein
MNLFYISTSFYPDENEDMSRKHMLKTWRGKIDGTCPGLHGEEWLEFAMISFFLVFNSVCNVWY